MIVIDRSTLATVERDEAGSSRAGSEGETGDDPARVYPTGILNYHEVVNDRFRGVPVAVTWCPLCASAVVYDRRVAGRTLTIGITGKLADDVRKLPWRFSSQSDRSAIR